MELLSRIYVRVNNGEKRRMNDRKRLSSPLDAQNIRDDRSFSFAVSVLAVIFVSPYPAGEHGASTWKLIFQEIVRRKLTADDNKTRTALFTIRFELYDSIFSDSAGGAVRLHWLMKVPLRTILIYRSDQIYCAVAMVIYDNGSGFYYNRFAIILCLGPANRTEVLWYRW